MQGRQSRKSILIVNVFPFIQGHYPRRIPWENIKFPEIEIVNSHETDTLMPTTKI